jgi:hypothetical protein
VAQIDFNTADLSSLIERIETITDPRDPRGVRHDFASTLVLTCVRDPRGQQEPGRTRSGATVRPRILTRLGARISPSSGLRIAPSYATIRRAAMAVDADEFDLIVNT